MLARLTNSLSDPCCRTKAIDEPSALQFLPDRLRTEMAIHVHLDVLKKVSPDLVDIVLAKLKLYTLNATCLVT